MTQRTATMAIYRDVPGQPDEPEEEIEVEVFGSLRGAEPDVGIMSTWCEDIWAKRLDNNVTIELTEKEEAKAQELLCDQDDDDYC